MQNHVGFVHADVDGAEQGGKTPGAVQLRKKDKGADEHEQAVGKRHGAVEIEYDGSGADGNAGELVDNKLRQHIKLCCIFQG